MSFLKDDPAKWQSSEAMPPLRSSHAAKPLHGMLLADAFKAFVIHDAEVLRLSKALGDNNRIRFMLAEGQVPGLMVDFRWPLDATPESMAYMFVSTPVVSFWERPEPDPPPAIIAICAVLADRIGALRDLLGRGQLIAYGTFEKTGIEGQISPTQWRRSGVSIDVQKGDLCEGQGYQAEPKYTGIVLRCPDLQGPTQTSVLEGDRPEQSNAKIRARISEKSKKECYAWLCDLMRASPNRRTFSKDQLLKEAQERWPGLSKNALEELRRRAIEETGASEWGFAGAPRKDRKL